MAVKGDYLGAGLELVEIIRPLLHHLAAFLDELGTVIGSPERIRHAVRELVLDNLGLDVQFLMQDRACHGAEAVAGDFGLRVIAQAA